MMVDSRLEKLVAAFQLLMFVPHHFNTVYDLQETCLQRSGLPGEGCQSNGQRACDANKQQNKNNHVQ